MRELGFPCRAEGKICKMGLRAYMEVVCIHIKNLVEVQHIILTAQVWYQLLWDHEVYISKREPPKCKGTRKKAVRRPDIIQYRSHKSSRGRWA